MNLVTPRLNGGSTLEFIHTALHHLSESLHRCLLCTLEAALCEEGTDNDLQGAPPGQVVVLCRAGSCFQTASALENTRRATDTVKPHQRSHQRRPGITHHIEYEAGQIN